MIIDQKAFASHVGIVLTSMLGALNDNIVKASLIVFAAMTAPEDLAASVGLIAAGLLMAPFILFSGWAGALADKCEKAKAIRVLKWTELGLSIASLAAMVSGSLTLMLTMVFLMGVQSAFYGPLKLGWLPERIHKDLLVRVNGWLETLTFVGILAGTVAGSLLGGPDVLVFAGVASICIAAAGVATARVLPTGVAANPDLKIPYNPLKSGFIAVGETLSNPISKRAALLASWFWAAGSIYLSTLPAQLEARLGDGQVITALVMAIFALGVGGGSFVSARAQTNGPGLKTTFPGLVLIGVSAITVALALPALPSSAGLIGFVGSLPGVTLCLALFGIAFGGGLFEVPLKAVMQSEASKGSEARAMAGYNILSSIGIVLSSIIVGALISRGVSQGAIYSGIAVSAGLALLGAIIAFPRAAMRSLGRAVFRIMNRVEITGLENIPQDGSAVIIANHLSFADGPMLFSYLDFDMDIAVNTQWANGKLLKVASKAAGIFPIDPQSPMSAKALAKTVQDGGRAMIFPEGRISVHGAMMKVYPGTSWIVDMARAPVIPVHIEGTETSIWNRKIPGLKRRLFQKVRITIGAPAAISIPEEIKGKARRKIATDQLRAIMEDIRMSALLRHQSLPEMLHDAFMGHSEAAPAIIDPLGNAFSRKKLNLGAAAFSRVLQRETCENERVGVLLPGIAPAAIVLMGLWRAGRVPAILNPTLGPAPMLSSIRTGHLKTILSSRDFVAKAKLEDVIEHLQAEGLRIIWTDDLKKKVSGFDKLCALRASRRAVDVITEERAPAAILYTSGTEGDPKGVVLTHEGLVANIAQLRARTDISSRDRVLSAMPLFHSFGLTGGLLLPLVAGSSLMIYPSPLHYRVIPQLAYDHQATLVFGTDTFLAGWAKRAEPADFASLRAAIAGAEAVKDTTRTVWAEKFGVRLLEGYGATEAGPVIALNTPDANKSGTVGRLLPGIRIRQEAVPGLKGGQLHIQAPNLMAGYLLPGNTGEITGMESGWYDTGDVVSIDEEGFVSISGRVKRFAKVGGEMVSLSACEALASKTWPDHQVAAITRKDERKGEKVIMVTTAPGATRKDIQAMGRDTGIAEIQIPSEVLVVANIPLLASGKTDYPGLGRMLEAQVEAA